MGPELTREERDRFERLQVEAVELQRLLAEAPGELGREEESAAKACALRDELQAAVRARDEALKEPRDRVRWLEKDARHPKKLEPSGPIALLGAIFKIALLGIGGGLLLCIVLARIFGGAL